MDAKTLLDNFGTVADAPGGVDRLRELILELALSGRLSQADRDDEPVDALLGRLRSDRERTIEEWGFREQKPGSPVASDELPQGVPTHWAWVRLAEVAHPQAGFAFKSTGFNEVSRGLPLVRIRDIGTGETECFFDGDYREEFVIAEGDYLVGMDGNFNIRRWSGSRALLNQRVTRLVFFGDEVERQFVVWALQGEINKLHGSRAYTTVQHLSGKQIAAAMIPLPPVAEQHRIVAKVDELMQLCDDLEARQQARHDVTTRLRASSLDALTNAETDDDLRTAWSRVHANWEALTDHPDNIDALRQSLLHLAIRGKLVNQRQRDRPALDFIDQIRKERHQRNLRTGMEAVGKSFFRIPATWTWTTFGFITDARLGKMLDKAKNTGPYRPYLRNTNVQWFRFETDDVAELRLEEGEYEEYKLHVGDLLICEGGEPGRAAVCGDTVAGLVFQKALHRARPLLGIEPWYLAFLLRSYAAGGLLAPYFTGATIKHLTGRSLARLPVPLPPIDEQRRIVDRVWELMRLCDDLEASLASRRRSQEKLARTLTSAAATAGAPSPATSPTSPIHRRCASVDRGR